MREELLLLPKHKTWSRKMSKKLKMSVSHLARFIFDVVGEMSESEWEKFIKKYK